MDKLLEVVYKTAGALKSATIEVDDDFTDEAIIKTLEAKGERDIELLEYEEYEEVVDGWENAACDNAGFCIGSSCRYYYTHCNKKGE